MDESPAPGSTNVFALAVIFEGGLGLLALGLNWLLRRPSVPVQFSASAVALGCAASLPLFLLLVLTRRFPVGPLARLNRVVSEVVVPIFARCNRLEFAGVSLLAGFGEELLFRGLVQGALADWLAPGAGLVIASILFGLAHPISLAYCIMAAIFGLYFGGLWLLTDNLLVPIVAHAAYDFLALVYLVRPRENSAP